MDHDQTSNEPIAREGEHIAPTFQSEAFHCPRCNVLARQVWFELLFRSGGGLNGSAIWMSGCQNCDERSYWVPTGVGQAMRMAEPVVRGGPRPHIEMPADVRADYEEARAIVMQSPRGACALLRLATQKLADDLVNGDGNLNAKIRALVAQGLSTEVAQALDALRVVGNNAVHPLEMVLDDDIETATALFECLNLIVEDRIARPKRVGTLFGKLPQGAREGIEKRDGNAQTAIQPALPGD
jgi:hypothetical protein